MYHYALDNLKGVLVGRFAAKPRIDEPDDYGKMEASIAAVDEITPSMGETVFVLIVPSDWPQPNAMYRKRFADLRDKLRHPMIFTLISTSSLIRGVVTAVNWVSPPKRGAANACGTVEEAIAAAEKRLGQKIPSLYKLYSEVNNVR